MTTEVTTTVQPTSPETAQPETTLAVEAVTTAAEANATAETALETARENEEAIEEVETQTEEIAAEIARVEEWQRNLMTEVSTIKETVVSLTTIQGQMAEVLSAMVAQQTPPTESPPSEGEGAPANPMPEAAPETPSEPHDHQEPRKRHQWI